MTDLGNHIIINYHYVRDSSPEWPGIHPCPVKEFERQIKFLSKNFRIVSVPAVLEAAISNRGGKFCAITFDDGLKDNYLNALPILRKYNATGNFFIITSTLQGKLPATHKMHLLLSSFSVQELIEAFNGFIGRYYPDQKESYFIPRDYKLSRTRDDETITANFKEIMAILPRHIREQFLKECFHDYFQNEKEIVEQLFMSEGELLKMRAAGMVIGSHSHSHYSLDSLDGAALKEEFRLSMEILSDLLGEDVDIFSYPHGHHTFQITEFLKEAGFRYGVTIESRPVMPDDNPLLLPRYDSNRLKARLSQ